MVVKIEKLSRTELEKRGVFDWPVWTKEVSTFPWTYSSTEECYLLDGEVVVETDDGGKVTFGQGDFVTFPKGFSCKWNVKKPVRKHYSFK